jgi:quercetin dioxygenase-like cupin family protein
MLEKSNESTPKRPEGERALDAALVTVNLPFYIDQIKNESSWKESDRNAITIFKSEKLRLVLVALRQAAEMARHTSPGILHIQTLEGKIRFITDQQTVELNKNQMLVLHERIPHSVVAETEAVFLLSISIC